MSARGRGNVVAFLRSGVDCAPDGSDVAGEQDWIRSCAYSLVAIDPLIGASDAADLAAEMCSHARWRKLEPDEAAGALFTCSLS